MSEKELLELIETFPLKNTDNIYTKWLKYFEPKLKAYFAELQKLTNDFQMANTTLLDDLKVIQDEIDRKVYSNSQEVFDRILTLISFWIKEQEQRLALLTQEEGDVEQRYCHKCNQWSDGEVEVCEHCGEKLVYSKQKCSKRDALP